MSLINQVLKDLESRRGHASDTAGLRPASGDQHSRDWPRWFVALAVAVTLGVTLFVAERLWRVRDAAAPEPVVTPVATTPPVRVDEPAATEVESTPGLEPELEIVPTPEPAIDTGSDLGPDPETASLPTTESEPEPQAGPEPEAERTAPARTESPVETVAEPPVETVEESPAIVQKRTLRTSSPRQRADEAYRNGVRALTEGRRTEAEREFRAALGHDASLHAARLALANLLATNGLTREAEVQLQQGLRIAPGESGLADRYARLLLARGDLGGAIGVLGEAPPPLEAEPEYHALLAALLQRAGHHEQAADKYAALVRHSTERSMWWVGLAISLEALDRGDSALEAYRRAERDPRLSSEVTRFVTSRIAALQDAASDPTR